MAISGGDGSIILTTKVDESGLKKGFGGMKKFAATAGKALLAIGAAAATATVAITKMATDAYAEYEQLVGGVETLFKGSANKVMAYAENAFYTAGVSANEYMKQVTSFSASLIRSTAGDTDKAADIANTALIDISDNVNKMGSSMESVTLAYQGFAKQQYMLLDNLKLGYGGTKTEMERLLRDAQALTGVKYDINNLADVYSAIHAIQEELGITGTTAKEAEKTITGSANMMKAAWQNVLSAIAGGGDLDKAINNLVYSIQKYFENIVPVVERSLQGIGQLIERVAPMLVQTVARSLIKAIPSLLNAVYQMIIGLAKGIYEGIIALFSGGAQKVVEAQTNEIAQSVKNQNALTEAVEETAKAQKGALAGFDEINTLSKDTAESQELSSAIGGIGGASSPSISLGTQQVEQEMPAFVQKILSFISPITEALGRLFEPIKESFDEVDWEGMRGDVSNWLSAFSNTGIDTIARGIDSIRVSFETLKQPLQDFWNNTLKPIIEDFGGWIIDIVNQTGESFDYFSEKITEHKDEISLVVEGIGEILSTIWAIIKPIIDSIIQGIFPVLKTTIDFIFSIIDVLGNFFGFFKNIFAGIKELIQGDTDEAIGYFKQALANFVNVFVGIGNAIISVINNLWTLIFDAFKGTVNAIFGLVGKIGSWLGKKWDIQWTAKAPLIPLIPKYVPKLATGTVVPPNREFMAVLGDNKREPEIVSPLSTMKQAVAEVLAQANIGGGFNGRIEIPVIVSGREIARAVRESEQDMGKQTVFGGFANAY
jgi:phage-related protein